MNDQAEDTVYLNTKNLDGLIKALKENMSRARVGILGAKTNRKDPGATNAGIGAIHEFGSSKMPMRSFLRVPIADNLQKRLEDTGALDKDVLNDVVKQGTVVPWLKKIAVLAEGIVAEAFASRGFGKWPAWRTPGYKNRDNRILVDTGQLRDSITSEVK